MANPIPQFKAHPWHGVAIGDGAPDIVNCYIEIVPSDSVKYEIDKETGHLKVDRPRKYSNRCPALYGFVPQTYCGKGVGEFCAKQTGRSGIVGDGDPLDIMVLTEKTIPHGDILVRAIPIGGLRMIDRGQADDKLLAVLQNDVLFGNWTGIKDCPERLLENLRHYFLTYKTLPGGDPSIVEIPHIYDAAEAKQIIRLSQSDYRNEILAKS